MSEHHDPVESDLLKLLTETRLMLHQERCRRESSEAALRIAEAKVAWLQKADRLVVWTGTEWQVRHQLDGQSIAQ